MTFLLLKAFSHEIKRSWRRYLPTFDFYEPVQSSWIELSVGIIYCTDSDFLAI